MKQTITIIDENFEEKSLEMTYAQLKELNRWLNIYLNTGKTIEYKMDKSTKKIMDVKPQKFKHIHFDPIGGISGDMILAACCDLGADCNQIQNCFKNT
jgi:hypothetical protein